MHWPFRQPRRGARVAGREALPAELADLALLDLTRIFERLASSPAGLDETEATSRLASFGPNTVAREEHQTLAVQIARRLLNPLNVLLLTLATVSAFMRQQQAAAIILAMVVLSLALSTVQERRSARAARKLRALVHTTATVLRPSARAPGGEPLEIPIERLFRVTSCACRPAT